MVSFAEPKQDQAGKDLGEAVDAIEELIAEFGVKAVVVAFLRSRAGEQVDKTGGNATLRAIQVILREIAYAQDPRLKAKIMAMGAGIVLRDKDTMTRLAQEHGLSRAAISKQVVKFCEEHRLPPSSYMRTEKDRKTYALTNQPRTA